LIEVGGIWAQVSSEGGGQPLRCSVVMRLAAFTKVFVFLPPAPVVPRFGIEELVRTIPAELVIVAAVLVKLVVSWWRINYS